MMRKELRDGAVTIRWDGDETLLYADGGPLTLDETREVIATLERAVADRESFLSRWTHVIRSSGRGGMSRGKLAGAGAAARGGRGGVDEGEGRDAMVTRDEATGVAINWEYLGRTKRRLEAAGAQAECNAVIALERGFREVLNEVRDLRRECDAANRENDAAFAVVDYLRMVQHAFPSREQRDEAARLLAAYDEVVR